MKTIQVTDPVCSLHVNITLMHKSLEDDAIALDKATISTMFGCIEKAISW